MNIQALFFSFLFVLALGTFTPLKSQTITISEELPFRNDFSYTILGWLGGNLLLFRDKGHEFYIQAFDEEMHLKWEREIYLGPRKADIIGIVAHDLNFHLLFGMRDKGDYIVQHRSYDHTVTLIDSMTIGKVENVFISPYFLMSASEDESKVVVFREANNGLQLYSYDLNARKVLWDNMLEFTGGNLHRDYSSMQVDNDGNFYLVLEPEKFMQRVQSLEIFYSLGSILEHQTLDLFS